MVIDMEQDLARNAYVIQEDAKFGTVKIADDVVAMIAALAATELAITMEYGFNIPATCQQVQNKVKSAIENMTGLEVTDVNIRIAGINVTKEK